MHKLTSSELCFTSLQCFIKSASRSPVIRKKTKICVPHDCSASHDCVWTSTVGFVSFGLYLVSNKTCKNKTLVSPCQKNEIRSHIPLSNLTGDARRRAKKQFHLPRKFPTETHALAGQKKLLLLVVSCSVQTAHIQGFFLPARTAAKMALASSLL